MINQQVGRPSPLAGLHRGPLGAWFKLFCTTRDTELRIHLSAAEIMARDQAIQRGPVLTMLERVREMMRLDQPN